MSPRALSRSARSQCSHLSVANVFHAPSRRAMSVHAASHPRPSTAHPSVISPHSVARPTNRENKAGRQLLQTLTRTTTSRRSSSPRPSVHGLSPSSSSPRPSVRGHSPKPAPNRSSEERSPLSLQMKLRRQKTLQNLAAVLQAKYGSGYEVEPFGSTCYGASCSSSDIDVSILDPERPFGFDPKDEKALPPIYSVRSLSRLFMKHGYTNVICIAHAAVPIVRLTDPETGMSCDVNVNCRLGTYNTKLIRQYCLRLPPLAQYIRNIKLWVKSKDLNNPSTRGVEPSFSSYAITLMTIAYLQSLGFLPNLQTDRYPIFETHFWERSSSGARRTRVDVRFGARKLWKPAPGSLPPIERWFNFWAHEFDYAKEMVSVRHGGIVPRPPIDDQGKPKQYRGDIVVLDPFQEKNVARRISARILGLFRESCEAAVRESDVVFKANRVSDKAAELLTEEFRKALKYEP